MKVLIDTNIIVDFIIKREPFFSASDKIVNLCIDKKIIGYMAAHSVSNIFYILRKNIPSDKRRRILIDLCNIFTVASIDSSKIINALENENFSDFEDCLQDECAYCADADFIITRNIKDFSDSRIKAIIPEDFIEIIKE